MGSIVGALDKLEEEEVINPKESKSVGKGRATLMVDALGSKVTCLQSNSNANNCSSPPPTYDNITLKEWKKGEDCAGREEEC